MADRKMWKVAAEKGGRLFDTFHEQGIVAMGVEGVGDLAPHNTRKKVAVRLQAVVPKWTSGKIAAWAGMLFRFQHEVEVGDHVVTYDPGRRRYLLGTIRSECLHRPGQIPGDPYLREVAWDKEVERDALSTTTKNSLGAISTLFLVPARAAKEILSVAAGKKVVVVIPDGGGTQPVSRLEEVESEASELTKDCIAGLDWEELQELVAGLLRAMGYKTRVSAAGPDRGKDIVASPDGFGFENPRIVVEVKHRHQSMGAQDVRSFLGGRHAGDKGLYVSTGGFTKDAYYEAERANIPMTLMTLDDLVQALLEHYQNLDIETQRLVPLKLGFFGGSLFDSAPGEGRPRDLAKAEIEFVIVEPWDAGVDVIAIELGRASFRSEGVIDRHEGHL